MKLEEIYENINFLEIINKQNLEINNFSNDTQNINNNDVYIGIKGEHFDGNSFYKDAFNKGAVCAILDNKVFNKDDLKDGKKTIILVEDSIKTLGILAKYKREKENTPLVAITGSAGKTSTKDMTYSVLSQKFKTLKTNGNKNNHIGLPLTLLSLKNEEMIVLEMGMNHFGEIDYLTNIAKPNVVIINNIGTAHIGNLGSKENILKAKLEILNGLDKNGLVIINNDDNLLHKWYEENKNNYNIMTYGITNKSDVMASNITLQEEKSIFTYDNTTFEICVGGEHYVYNALASICVGKYYNISPFDMRKALKNFELSSNRMNLIQTQKGLIINDSYNANYDAVKYAIRDLGRYNKRKIAVLGTMKELGDFSMELHYKLGTEIVNNNIDILITVGEFTNYINQSAIEKGFNINNSYHLNNNEEAINLIKKIQKEEDVILVKASQSCNFKEIVEKIK